MVDIRQLLIHHLGISPTDQQRRAFDFIAHFLATFSSDDAFVLRGYAGTGKTTIINTIVKTAHQLHLRTVLLAPTGRAAKVISKYTGRKALTIHKKIYRQKSAASVQLEFSLSDNLHEDTIFVIDEASMISDEPVRAFRHSLLEDLVTYVRSGKHCALFFVGDSAQLPPVGVLDSPALDAEYIQANYGLDVTSVELTDVVRQSKSSGILYNATKLREQIKVDEPDDALPFPKFHTNTFNDIFRMTGERLIEGLHYSYAKFGIENTMVICRSNKSANLYNQHIRNQILFRDEEITGGDLIMVVKNNYYWLQQHDETNTGFIANGDMAELKKVGNVHDMHGFRFADVELEFLDGNEQQSIRCRVLLDSLYVDSPNLPYDKQQMLFESISADYEDIRDKTKRLDTIKQDPYFNALQIKFAYAITCHKAQGGQWPAVFVDQGYMVDEMMNTDFLRWLYTALTRATQELYLVNFSKNFF